MPFKTGKNAEIWLDAVDASQYFNDATFTVNVSTADTSTFKSSWTTAIEGEPDASLAAKGFYDLNIDAQEQAIIQNGGSVLTYFPAGCVAVGDLARLIKVHETGLNESTPVGGAVLMDATYKADGIVGFGIGLHTMSAADVGTTTGAIFDGGAASSTGWISHLHMIAVTGSPTSVTVKLTDASASNFSDGADVTGGGFTATNVPTSQRLVSAAHTTTLRRYVRYVATFVGGTAPTATFGLVVARNG